MKEKVGLTVADWFLVVVGGGAWLLEGASFCLSVEI